jgi:hypothetical protein
MCGAGQPHIELLEIEDKRLQLSEALAVLLEDVVGLGLAAYADLLCHQPRDFDASIAFILISL